MRFAISPFIPAPSLTRPLHGRWQLPPPELASAGPNCSQNEYGVQQMFLTQPAAHVVATATGFGSPVAAVRLDCGRFSEVDEKNWIAFMWEGQLLYVYSIYPHRIMHVRPADGECMERKEWLTTFTPLLDPIAANTLFHGSGTATLVEDASGQSFYYALMHSITDGSYSTMAYKFEAQPPFAIIAIGKPLPLQQTSRAFASGLLLLKDESKAVITYGVDDAQSRVLVMDTEAFESTFEC